MDERALPVITAQQERRYGNGLSSDLLPSHIVWIKWLVFFHHRPRKMQQLPGSGTSGDFFWLPSYAQASIEGLDDGVMLHGTQGRHVERSP
jgi:hypothetical protein